MSHPDPARKALNCLAQALGLGRSGRSIGDRATGTTWWSPNGVGPLAPAGGAVEDDLVGVRASAAAHAEVPHPVCRAGIGKAGERSVEQVRAGRLVEIRPACDRDLNWIAQIAELVALDLNARPPGRAGGRVVLVE